MTDADRPVNRADKPRQARAVKNQMSSQLARALRLASVGVIGGAATEVSAEAPAPAPVLVLPAKVQAKVAVLGDQQAPLKARLSASEKLGALADPSAIKPLLMVSQDAEDSLKEAIDQALEKLQATRHLIEGLRAAAPEQRAEAATLLGIFGRPSAEAALIKCLADKEATVREAAALALAFCGEAAAAPALIERLQRDEAADVRSAAAQALGQSEAASAHAALTAAHAAEKDAFVKVFIEMALKARDAAAAKSPKTP